MKTEIPCYADLVNEPYELILQEAEDDGWRHGHTLIDTYYRRTDDTYWQVSYRVNKGGDWNEFHEMPEEKATRVQPKTVTVTTYVRYED